MLETADAAVVVLAADHAVSAREMDLLSTVMNVSVAAFVVLNKADYLTPPQLAEVGELTRLVLSTAASRADARAGHPGSYRAAGTGGIRLYPMSARAAILAGDPGFAAFAADFTHYLASRHLADLTRSAAAQAHRTTTTLLGEAQSARRQSREHAARLSGRVERFTTRLGALTGECQGPGHHRRRGARPDALGPQRRGCGRCAPLLRRGIASRLEATFSDELQAASATEIDRLGGQRLASFTQEAVSGWRCQQQARVQQGLTALDQRLRMELAGAIGAVRIGAAELPGLDLAVPETDRQLAVDWQFPGRTVVAVDPPWPVLRPSYRVFPSEPGRRRVRQHLRDQIPELTAACLEEANAALQQELTQLARTLAQATEHRYANAGETIRTARHTAAELGERATADAGRTDSTLDKQEQALRRVASLLLRAEE